MEVPPRCYPGVWMILNPHLNLTDSCACSSSATCIFLRATSRGYLQQQQDTCNNNKIPATRNLQQQQGHLSPSIPATRALSKCKGRAVTCPVTEAEHTLCRQCRGRPPPNDDDDTCMTPVGRPLSATRPNKGAYQTEAVHHHMITLLGSFHTQPVGGGRYTPTTAM